MLQTRSVRTTDENRAKRSEFMEGAQPLLTKYNIPVEVFLPKAVVEENNEKFIRLYPMEIAKNSDLYIELVTLNYEPVRSSDGVREIRLWKYNPHYDAEYHKINILNSDVYLIPIAEMTVISKETEKAAPVALKTKEVPTLDKVVGKSLLTDIPFNEMTVRDFVAIYYRKPLSRKKWLNDLITNNNE